MAGDNKKLQPVIIKRVKKGGHAAHGGAWKIAYADFVTAMMAFFLLMWLLGSTTEGDRKGIADYFSMPLKLSLASSGSGAGDASHVVRGGGQDITRTVGQVRQGDIEAPRKTFNLQALRAEQRKADEMRLEELKRKLQARIDEDSKLSQLSGQIKLDMTRDGLRIQIIDEQDRPMFALGSAVVQPYMRDLLRDLGKVLAEVPHRLTLEGHTDRLPYAGGDRGYSNWELSADRANASRRELMAGNLPEDRVLRVMGLASSSLFDADNPAGARNRRISIIVMNRDAEDRFFRTAPEVATALDTESVVPAPLPGSVLPALPMIAAPAVSPSR